MKKNPPIVYVEWVDAAHAGGGWEDLKFVKMSRGRAAGFLVHDGDDFIVVASALDTPFDKRPKFVAGEFTIPSCAITHIRYMGKL